MNTYLRRKSKEDFENDFFQFISNAIFIKMMGNMRKQRHIELVTTQRTKNYLVPEPNYHTTKFSQKIYQQQK